MNRLRQPALALALTGGLLACASVHAQAQAQAARERMTRMAEGTPAALAGPAAAEPVSVGEPAAAASEAQPLAPRTVGSRDAEPLPSAGSGGNSAGGYVLPTLAALGVVLGLLYGLKAVAAKLGGITPARPSASVEVLSRTAVGAKGHVLLLRVGGRVLVVGDSAAGGLRTLDRIDDEDEVAELLRATTAAAGSGIDFGALLASVGKKQPEAPATPPAAAPDPLAGVKARLEQLGGRA